MFRTNLLPINLAKTVYAVALLVVFFLISLATAHAAPVTLAWNASNGTVAGYNVYTRTVSGSYGPAQPAASTTYTTPDLEAGTYYFVVKARDSEGKESGPSNEVSSTTYTFTTQPNGLSLSYNGVSRVTPFTLRATVGSSQQISAPNQSNYTFSSWSDGGAATHAITIGASPQTITANYTATVPTPVVSCAVSTTNPTTATSITYTGSSSGGSVSTWSWNFHSSFTGARTGSTVVGNYTIHSPSPYTATVTATYSDGSNRTATCPSVTVTAAPPVASFSAAPTSVSTSLPVTFTNGSTGTAPLTYAWTFGDGSNSNERDPSHTYATTGTFTVNLTVTDGNNQTATAQPVSITVAAASADSGLVAAYNFQETTGTVVVDESGNGNHGTLSCNTYLNSACTVTARTTRGKYGKALSFDGLDDWVTVNDSASLDLTNGMTLEAWVYPTATMSGWQSVITKEQPGGFGAVYYLAANSDLNQPEVAIYNTSWKKLYGGSAPSVNRWTHLAGTYDGATLRLYANGSLVSSQAQTGGIQVTNGALRIGGNDYWGEVFRGWIDEIRIYNRALSASEIQTDMNTSVVTKLLVGDSSTTKSVTDAISQNVAEAFKKTATVTGKVTSLRIYVDSGSTSTRLVAGLYEDNNGHPGALRAQGALNNPKANAWNTVPLTTAPSVTKDSTYWIAILSPTGILQFVDKVRGKAEPSETSAETNLTSLPDPWTTGTVLAEGPLAGYGAGN